MKQVKLLLLIIACITTFTACKKDKTELIVEPIPIGDQLPAITQTGANTFGCLVNGKVYIPKGYRGNGSPNPKITYDIGLNGRPYLGIIADQIINSSFKGEILIAFRNLDHLGVYSMPDDFNFSATWVDVIGNCGTIAFDTTIKKWGSGIISKLDIPNQIISGTFNCKYKTLTCDTVFITDGRFDIKF
jgi:hypothetical protein